MQPWLDLRTVIASFFIFCNWLKNESSLNPFFAGQLFFWEIYCSNFRWFVHIKPGAWVLVDSRPVSFSLWETEIFIGWFYNCPFGSKFKIAVYFLLRFFGYGKQMKVGMDLQTKLGLTSQVSLFKRYEEKTFISIFKKRHFLTKNVINLFIWKNQNIARFYTKFPPKIQTCFIIQLSCSKHVVTCNFHVFLHE